MGLVDLPAFDLHYYVILWVGSMNDIKACDDVYHDFLRYDQLVANSELQKCGRILNN